MNGSMRKEHWRIPLQWFVIAEHEDGDEQRAENDRDPNGFRARTFANDRGKVANEAGNVEREKTNDIHIVDLGGK